MGGATVFVFFYILNIALHKPIRSESQEWLIEYSCSK